MEDRQQFRPPFHGPLKLHYAMRRSDLLPDLKGSASTSSPESAAQIAKALAVVSKVCLQPVTSQLAAASEAYARWQYPDGAPTLHHFESMLWWEDANFCLYGGYVLSFSGRAGEISCLSDAPESSTSLTALLGKCCNCWHCQLTSCV